MPDFSVTIRVSTGAAPADQYRELLRSAILTWANKKVTVEVAEAPGETAARLEALRTAIEAHMNKVEPALDRIAQQFGLTIAQRDGLYGACGFCIHLLAKHLDSSHPDVEKARQFVAEVAGHA